MHQLKYLLVDPKKLIYFIVPIEVSFMLYSLSKLRSVPLSFINVALVSVVELRMNGYLKYDGKRLKKRRVDNYGYTPSDKFSI